MVLSNVPAPGPFMLSSSLAIAIRGHVSLQGPLLVEMSGFSLTAAPMKAQAVEKKRRSTKRIMMAFKCKQGRFE